jgi:hypothetical protein
MMKLPQWLRDFHDKVGEKVKIDPSRVKPLISITYGCGTSISPDFTKLIVGFGRDRTQSLYYNGIFFFRLMLPFYVGFMIRWKGITAKDEKAFLQCHVGWKLNGDLAFTLRLQSDDSAFESDVGPEFNNTGQAQGWACGTK